VLNVKILLLIDQCASHLKNTIFVSNIKVLFLPANYTTQPLKKAGDEEDYNQVAAQMKLDVLSAVHLIAEPSRLIICTIIKNCIVKYGFSSSNDDSAVALSEDEEDDWHSLQPLGVQSEDYPTCDSALEVYRVQSVDQVLGQHLTRPKEKPEEEEEVAEHKATFLDASKGLEASRKYINQFYTENNITVMYNKVENKLYRLRVQGEKTQKTG
jgi:RNA-binding protein YlmH